MDKETILTSPIAAHESHWLEMRCCKGVTYYPVRLLLSTHKARGTVSDVVERLRCKNCGKPPQEVSLTDNAQQTAIVKGWTARLVP